MTSARRRLQPAASGLALALALLALVASAAGVGYAAGQIGTSEIRNKAITTAKIRDNAVTATKVKDGSLTAKDLVREEKQRVPTFTNGGEGDCVWQPGDAVLPGLGGPTYRMDRFGRVVLTGVAIAQDGAGGDGTCNAEPGQYTDGIAFILPPAYRPAKTLLLTLGTETMVVAGPGGLVSGAVSLPPGSVWSSGSAIILDTITFEPVGSKLVAGRPGAKPTHPGLARQLGLG
ncbi:hypothetical protein [Nocardioides sp.]|uniref:hypothetical protein n=1 Tax=Nocardioides sp. TaxID=35761 RepID=UPI0035631B03